MDQHLANMIVRSEHRQRQTSHTPILDFDRRGHVCTPGWLEQGLGKLQRLIIRLITRLANRMLMRYTGTQRTFKQKGKIRL